MHDPRQAFCAVLRAVLGSSAALPDTIEPGRLHRFSTSERRSDSAGWCKLFDDMRGGVFGCYRQGISETWRAADRAAMTLGQRVEQAQQVMAGPPSARPRSANSGQ